MIRSEDIRDRVRDIDEYLLNKCKESKTIEKRDWRTYEQRLMNRVKGAIHNLEPLIDEATNIEIRRVWFLCPKKIIREDTQVS